MFRDKIVVKNNFYVFSYHFHMKIGLFWLSRDVRGFDCARTRRIHRRMFAGCGCVRVLEVLVKLNQRTYTYNNGGGWSKISGAVWYTEHQKVRVFGGFDMGRWFECISIFILKNVVGHQTFKHFDRFDLSLKVYQRMIGAYWKNLKTLTSLHWICFFLNF